MNRNCKANYIYFHLHLQILYQTYNNCKYYAKFIFKNLALMIFKNSVLMWLEDFIQY